jgi:hypothetical protein
MAESSSPYSCVSFMLSIPRPLTSRRAVINVSKDRPRHRSPRPSRPIELHRPPDGATTHSGIFCRRPRNDNDRPIETSPCGVRLYSHSGHAQWQFPVAWHRRRRSRQSRAGVHGKGRKRAPGTRSDNDGLRGLFGSTAAPRRNAYYVGSRA